MNQSYSKLIESYIANIPSPIRKFSLHLYSIDRESRNPCRHNY